MDKLAQDLRHALRALRRDTGFTVAIVLTLAVGVGLNTAVFGIVRSTLLRPLPYTEPDRLAMVWTSIAEEGIRQSPSAFANVQDWKAQNHVFEDLATFDPTSLTLTGGAWPEQISAAKVSANLFALLRVAPAVGSVFTTQQEQQQLPLAVLSHGLWQRRFNGSRAAIGRTIEIGAVPFQVIGVMPEGFGFPDDQTEAWLPQTLFTDWAAEVVNRGTGAWRVVGRLRPGVSPDEARSEMNAIAARLEQSHPAANAGLGMTIVPLHDHVTGYSFRLALWMLFGAVGLVLLIACSNVAHLFLARGINRSHEFALRVALGATTPRLLRQSVTESMVLSLAAGITGLFFAVAGLRLFVLIAPTNIPRLNEIAVDPAVLVYGIGVSLITGILLGFAPALSSSRGSPYEALREGRGHSERTRTHRARRLLIAGQFALAIMLVFGANLLIRSLIEAQRIDPGFRSDNVLMANLSVESESGRIGFYEQAVQSVQAIPGVHSAGIVEELFIGGAPNRPITIERNATAEPVLAEIRIDAIDGDFFLAVDVPLRAGRMFSESDDADAAPVAIINETMARRFWPGEMPIGRRFRTGDARANNPWIEVVGVVGDMRRQGPERAAIAQVFRPYVQQPSRNMILLVRTDETLPGLAATIRTRIAAIDRSVPLYRTTTLEQALDRHLLQRRFQSLLLGLFSLVALLLAAIGIHGVMQYSVARRTREIGVRMALGAVSEQVVLMVVRQGMTVVLPGLAVGILGALWVSETISALLFGVAVADITNIAVTAGILLLTTVAACYLPGRRAARVDPMKALHNR